MTTMEEQAKELAKLKLGALRAKFQELVGAVTKSNNRPYLIKKILVATQPRPTEAPEPEEPAAAAPSAAEAKGEKKKRSSKQKVERDPRLPKIGEVIEREHEGKTVRVKVLEDGFSYRNKTYRSLSAIAKEATGTVWNGFLFFGLAKRPAA